jgi:RAD3-like DEAD/DEAH box helicase/helicase-like protein
MTLPSIAWENLRSLETMALKGELFSVLQNIAVEVQHAERDDPNLLATVPRLSKLIEERPHDLASFRESLSALARSVGLWNYIDQGYADDRDTLIARAVTVDGLGGITLHREQIAALNVLLAGRNLVLSAPTSFGKSVLIDALLLSGRYKRVAIVVPTIALLDEFRRRIITRFGHQFDVVMHHSEPATRDHIIFLGTQERLINRPDLGALDLAVVDEFYKLDPARRDERSMMLNATVYQLLKRARQFFFLGPSIEGVRISGQSPWRFDFLRTRFSTVAVDTIDLKGESDKDRRLREEAYKSENWPALVFVSSPDKAIKVAADLVATGSSVGSASDLAAWIDANYGGKWDVSLATTAGVGLHHGRIPRALASRFVRLFNDGRLPILVCTSTLIEGVNTAAKSVLIYDKTINRESYDFFTFSNIRGRAGRLGQHYVGKVFLFHKPPEYTDVDVSPPLFGDFDAAPDELVVHIDPADATSTVTERVEALRARLGLKADEVKRLSSLGVDNIEAIKDAVENALSESHHLVWSGRPEYDDIKAVCEIICAVRPAREFGVVSHKQLTMYLHKLREPGPITAFYRWHASGSPGDQSRYENVFRFLRACEYSLPEYFACVELFIKKVDIPTDYSLFIAELPRWFRPEPLKILEEQGVPIQISERFITGSDTVASLSTRLRAYAAAGNPALSGVERSWVLDAIPP